MIKQWNFFYLKKKWWTQNTAALSVENIQKILNAYHYQNVLIRVSDPHYFFADPDPVFWINAYSEKSVLARIQI